MAKKTEREALDDIVARFRRNLRLTRPQIAKIERLAKDYVRDMRRFYALARRPRRRT